MNLDQPRLLILLLDTALDRATFLAALPDPLLTDYDDDDTGDTGVPELGRIASDLALRMLLTYERGLNRVRLVVTDKVAGAYEGFSQQPVMTGEESLAMGRLHGMRYWLDVTAHYIDAMTDEPQYWWGYHPNDAAPVLRGKFKNAEKPEASLPVLAPALREAERKALEVRWASEGGREGAQEKQCPHCHTIVKRADLKGDVGNTCPVCERGVWDITARHLQVGSTFCRGLAGEWLVIAKIQPEKGPGHVSAQCVKAGLYYALAERADLRFDSIVFPV